MKKNIVILSAICLITPIIITAINQNKIQQTAIVETLLTTLQNKETKTRDFRDATKKLGFILANETSRHISTTKTTIETPLCKTDGYEITSNIVLAAVVRSGISLVEPMLNYFPDAKVGYIGLERNEETAIAELYYCKMPIIEPSDTVIMLEPMLATGGSASDTIKELLKSGAQEKNIIVVGIIGAIEGIERLKRDFPSINIVITKINTELDDKKFIVPGLGDFGDRFNETPVGVSGLER